MRRIGIIAVLSMLVVALAAVPALAQNPHFVTEGTANFGPTTVTVTGVKVAGLGSEPALVTLTAEGIAQVECTNPAGNVAPGQDTEVTVGATPIEFQGNPGQTTVPTITTLEPEDPSAAEVCPSRRWDADIVSVEFTSATLQILQNGVVVLEETFTP